MTIEVNTDAMRSHAAQVAGLQARADVAVDAAKSVSFTPDMYGKFGAELVYPLVLPLEVAGVAATGYVSGALATTAGAVIAMAETFDLVDGAVEAALDGLRKVIP